LGKTYGALAVRGKLVYPVALAILLLLQLVLLVGFGFVGTVIAV